MNRSVVLRLTELEDRATPAVLGFNVFGSTVGQPPVVTVTRSDGTALAQFFAYAPAFGGGVTAAAGDLTGDGFAEVITAAGPGGGPHVIAYNPFGGQVANFFAFPAAFTGGVWLAPVVATGQVLIGAGPTGA